MWEALTFLGRSEEGTKNSLFIIHEVVQNFFRTWRGASFITCLRSDFLNSEKGTILFYKGKGDKILSGTEPEKNGHCLHKEVFPMSK